MLTTKGYYIDVGAASLVADRKINLVQGNVDHLTENTVILDTGKELPADLVVYATGYGSMNGWVADLINPEVAAKVGKVWGLGSATTVSFFSRRRNANWDDGHLCAFPTLTPTTEGPWTLGGRAA